MTGAMADALRMAVPSDPSYLDPAYWGSTVDQFLIDNLYPRLGKYAAGDEWKIELDVAKSVDLSDPMKISFELKPGVMWSGGYGEVTAEDVEYSFERHLDPEMESGVMTEFEHLKDVEVTGKYTGIIHLIEPAATFWTSTLVYTSGAIISKAAAEEAGGYFEATPLATTGPYMLSEFEPGNKLVLSANPDWSGEAVDFDEIVLLPISDENAAELAFAAGEIDYTRSSAGNYDTLIANPPEGAVVSLAQTLDPLFLGITQTNEKLSDIRVRKAIQLSLDLPTIIQATTGGHGKQATGFIAEGLVGHRDGAALTRDVDQARALLSEAGADGLTVRLDYVKNTERDIAAQIMQANMAEAGIALELNGQDEGTFWSVDEIRAADLELHLKSWTGNPDGYYTMQYFIEDQIGYWNWEGFASDDYVALLAEARNAQDEAVRGEIYKQMQAMLEDSGSFVFISQEPTAILHRDTIEPGILPDGRPVFHAFRKAD
ncbi:ABC transporter substrate-binding protein [Roseovarius albus]|nr:ABC transporter substrate-binding protein [Roseovarius albus]